MKEICGNYREYMSSNIGCELPPGHPGHCKGEDLDLLPMDEKKSENSSLKEKL